MSFPMYQEYKNSEMDWIGKIPIGWETASLSKLFVIKAGGDVDAATFSETKSDDYPFPIYTNANDPEVVYGYTRRAKYGPNCITVSGRGYVGFATFRDHVFDAIIRLLVLTPTKRLSCKFIEYFINEVIDFREESSAVGQLSTTQIAPYKVALPTYQEQFQIACFLNHETAKIDALIREQERLIELLQEKRQAVISHAVTKGLDPDVPMQDSGVEWLGEVPAHWEVMPVKFLLRFVTSGSRGWAEFYSDEGDLFFRIANLTRDSIRPKLKSTQHVTPPENSEGGRARIQVGDILVSITADLGSVCAADKSIEGGYVSQHVALARPRMERCHSEWLAFFILGDAAKEQLLGSGYGGTKVQLSLEDIRELVVAVPPLDEQEALASMLHHRLGSMEVLIAEAYKAVALLSERRSALISAAVTGKIDVRKWQPPADESAFDEEVRQAGLEATA